MESIFESLEVFCQQTALPSLTRYAAISSVDYADLLGALIKTLQEFRLIVMTNDRDTTDEVIGNLEEQKNKIQEGGVYYWHTKMITELQKITEPLKQIFSDTDFNIIAYHMCERLVNAKRMSLRQEKFEVFEEAMVVQMQGLLASERDITEQILEMQLNDAYQHLQFIKQHRAFLSTLISKLAHGYTKTKAPAFAKELMALVRAIDAHPNLKKRAALFKDYADMMPISIPELENIGFYSALAEVFGGLDEKIERHMLIRSKPITFRTEQDWQTLQNTMRDADLLEEVKKSLVFVREGEERNNQLFFSTPEFFRKGYYLLSSMKVLDTWAKREIVSENTLNRLVLRCQIAIPQLSWDIEFGGRRITSYSRANENGFKLLCLRFPIFLDVFTKHLPSLIAATTEPTKPIEKRPREPLSPIVSPLGGSAPNSPRVLSKRARKGELVQKEDEVARLIPGN